MLLKLGNFRFRDEPDDLMKAGMFNYEPGSFMQLLIFIGSEVNQMVLCRLGIINFKDEPIGFMQLGNFGFRVEPNGPSISGLALNCM